MSSAPEISIVVPIYNALAHLKTGLASIAKQTFTNWELVAVNDGSTDETKQVFLELTKNWKQPVKLIDRVNGGGFAARNTGLDHASAKYIALFDIDDRWYAHHLQNLFEILETQSEIDWVYGANKIIDLTQNELVLAESNFYLDGKPKPFLNLATQKLGKANLLIDSRTAEFQFLYGLHLGQQFSLARRTVWEGYRFRAGYRNEGADQISVVRALKAGFKLAYVNEIHGEYAIHANNASAGCKGASLDKYVRLRKALIRGYKEAEGELLLNCAEIKAVNKTVAQNYFWNLGYNLHWENHSENNHSENNLPDEAFVYFKQGLRFDPWNLLMWKTYCACLLKKLFK